MKQILSILVTAVLTSWALGEDTGPLRSQGLRPTPGGERHGGGEGGDEAIFGKVLHNPEMMARLGLSDAQRQAMLARFTQLREAQTALKAQMDAAALKQARLMMADTVDEAALMDAVEEAGRLRTEVAKLRIRHLLFMRQALTPEQMKKMQTAMRERNAHRGEGRSPRERRPREGRDQGEMLPKPDRDGPPPRGERRKKTEE